MGLAIISCEDPTYENRSDLDSHVPYFSGSWTLSSVSQTDERVAPGGLKSVDVSALFLDEENSLRFTTDGDYSATGYFAETLGAGGNWQLDNDIFPTAVWFTSAEGTTDTLELAASILEFSDQLLLRAVSTGCDGAPATSYAYTFDKNIQ